MAADAPLSIAPFEPELDVAALTKGDKVDVMGDVRMVHSVGVYGVPPAPIVHWADGYNDMRADRQNGRSSEWFLRAVGAFKLPAEKAA